MIIDALELQNLIDSGYVIRRKHPVYDLYIYNYSNIVQYERYWTPLTLLCRGLILDSGHNIVARGPEKFFNLEELKVEDIPKLNYTIHEKMDGSYICVFKYNGELIVSSRGSFTSDYAIYAENLIKRNNYNFDFLSDGQSLIFELIAPWNRIVVDYGECDELVLLTAYNNDNGEWLEFSDGDLVDFAKKIGCNKARTCKHSVKKSFYDLKNMISGNNEGFVIRFDNGFRMKVKGEEYVRLHKIVTNLIPKIIWENYQDYTKWIEFIALIPDEFMDDIREVTDKLDESFQNYYNNAASVFNYLIATYGDQDRKVFAMQAKEYGELTHLLFAMYDGKDVKKIIWDKIKP